MRQEPHSAIGPLSPETSSEDQIVREENQRTWVQQQLTVPNIIALVSIVAGAGMMWSSADARDQEQDRRLTNNEAALTLTQTSTTEILKAIAVLQSDVKYLSRSIEQQQQQQQMDPAQRQLFLDKIEPNRQKPSGL